MILQAVHDGQLVILQGRGMLIPRTIEVAVMTQRMGVTLASIKIGSENKASTRGMVDNVATIEIHMNNGK